MGALANKTQRVDHLRNAYGKSHLAKLVARHEHALFRQRERIRELALSLKASDALARHLARHLRDLLARGAGARPTVTLPPDPAPYNPQEWADLAVASAAA